MDSEEEEQRLQLQFAEQNFDWLIDLEGSNNGSSWFLISEKNRVVSINNSETSYTYSTISFQPSQYKYLRLSLHANQQPTLISAQVYREYFDPGVFVPREVVQTKVTLEEKKKQTKIVLDLGTSKPVSYLRFDLDHDFDFYRPVRIEFLADSTVSEKGTHYRYHNARRGHLSSFEENEFHFSNQVTRQLLITIENQDNAPLDIGDISVQGNPTDLIARFGKAGNYFLCYGNQKVSAPGYDLGNFKSNIPAGLSSLTLGEEQENPGTTEANPGALFENPLWMWAILIAIILLLGVFTFRMLQSEQGRA